MALIYEALAAIMKEITPIAKGQQNRDQGFMFRGIDDVCNGLHDLFAEHGVVCIPEVLDYKEDVRQSKQGGNVYCNHVTVKYHLTASDGSEVMGVSHGFGFDSSDKSTNKAMSGALKMFLLEMFLIPTGQKVNPDEGDHDNIETVPLGPFPGRPAKTVDAKPSDEVTAIYTLCIALLNERQDGKELFVGPEKVKEKSKLDVVYKLRKLDDIKAYYQALNADAQVRRQKIKGGKKEKDQ